MIPGDRVEVTKLRPAYRLPPSYVGRRGVVTRSDEEDGTLVVVELSPEDHYFKRAERRPFFVEDLRVLTPLDLLSEL